MAVHDYLIEVRVEEMPAAAMPSAREDLVRALVAALAEAPLQVSGVEAYVTPRRLVALLREIPERQDDRASEILGPPAAQAFDQEGRPTGAASGFARAQGVRMEDLAIVDGPRGKTVAARRVIPGRSAVEILAEISPSVLLGMSFPKMMKWGAVRRPFVRPVHGVVALYGSRIVPFEIFGVSSGNRTVGHRLLGDEEIVIDSAEDYFPKLRGAYVEVDGAERRRLLVDLARRLAAEVGGSIGQDEDLADTLADLVEWPGLVRGSFDSEFLELPEEVLVTTMKTHQKYLPIRKSSSLTEHFLAVMDNREDRKGLIAKGNEWVLNARFADARFFWSEDIREPLGSRVAELAHLSFQEGLGDYMQKTGRLQDLSEAICHGIGRSDLVEAVLVAAKLSKVDLLTEMVREFTDLQGIMGGIYARREGQPEPVWRAIYDQYRPASVEEEPPRLSTGAILSLADRWDALAGIFGLGLVPTGSKDPYGLRRMAQGAMSIILACDFRVDWRSIARKAIQLYGDMLKLDADSILFELSSFLGERFRYLMDRRGFRYDEIVAVLAVRSWDFADMADRVAVLANARKMPEYRSLSLSFKRIRNIIGSETSGEPRRDLYREEAERSLALDFLQAGGAIDKEIERRRYGDALRMMASLAPALDRFFVEVLVHSPEEDLRANRVALLASIFRQFSRFADFSEVVAEK
jgi:glycyl-tRNA synthetase beta chain